jgi:hypothetical protein
VLARPHDIGDVQPVPQEHPDEWRLLRFQGDTIDVDPGPVVDAQKIEEHSPASHGRVGKHRKRRAVPERIRVEATSLAGVFDLPAAVVQADVGVGHHLGGDQRRQRRAGHHRVVPTDRRERGLRIAQRLATVAGPDRAGQPSRVQRPTVGLAMNRGLSLRRPSQSPEADD